MSRKRRFDGKRLGRTALASAVAAGLAAFALVWKLLEPEILPQPRLAAVAHTRGLTDDAELGQRDVLLAALLSPQNLRSAIREARFSTDDGEAASANSGSVEKARDRLRIDLGRADEAGVQTIAIRWTGEVSPAAARLINILASRLSQTLSAGDTTALEAAYDSARQAVREAARSLSETHRRLQSAVASGNVVPQAPTTELAPAVEDVDAPRLAPPLEPSRDDWLLLAQQLNDLESRRLTLSERLMPEHPEMKALDEKIEALRTRVSDQPPPAPVTDRPQFSQPVPPRGSPLVNTSQIARLADELVTAQRRYETATEKERAAWQSLCAARNGMVNEIEPATAVLPPPIHFWQRALIASLCGLMSSALLLSLWPVRRLTFSTVEEVRAVTRLPVVAISRHSLN